MTFGDKVIVVLMLAVSFAGMLIVNIFFYGQAGTSVVIEVNGQPYAKYNFNEITSSKYIEIQTQYGYNKVEIDKNRVRVVEADCPDKLDVLAGWISKSNQMIVCLPNRLVIKIEGKDTGLDGVVY
ncbi:NusG domain II-containing protein [Petroclostridium sp. X23]|uniref:NusG domain II-containing protein n=1 Tax=Petroclostridium sp. X23 TaxID=3045146 RepID=UPI0024AD490C|nr:NusG domain II-containing protein [Petroclostridium sp. X23]WHH61059.1 NusG domain II-containing protein [Petroclostridium sp. X23]